MSERVGLLPRDVVVIGRRPTSLPDVGGGAHVQPLMPLFPRLLSLRLPDPPARLSLWVSLFASFSLYSVIPDLCIPSMSYRDGDEVYGVAMDQRDDAVPETAPVTVLNRALSALSMSVCVSGWLL